LQKNLENLNAYIFYYIIFFLGSVDVLNTRKYWWSNRKRKIL